MALIYRQHAGFAQDRKPWIGHKLCMPYVIKIILEATEEMRSETPEDLSKQRPSVLFALSASGYLFGEIIIAKLVNWENLQGRREH